MKQNPNSPKRGTSWRPRRIAGVVATAAIVMASVGLGSSGSTAATRTKSAPVIEAPADEPISMMSTGWG